MDDSGEQESSAAYPRHRSPAFRKDEVKALINIVEKYKIIIFNRSTSASANVAKDKAWVKIAEAYNIQGFNVERSADSLRIKWDNMKKEARKLSNNLTDLRYEQFDDVIGPIVAMMSEAENNTSTIEPADSDDDLNDEQVNNSANDILNWNPDDNKDSDDSLDGDENEKLRFSNRSANFTNQENHLLLQCVRQEKDIVFSKETTSSFIEIKNKAWARITNSYNKLSPQKRSTKMLRTRFSNMKRRAKGADFKKYLKDFRKKRHKLEDSAEDIKSEPLFEYREDLVETSLVEDNHADDVDELNENEDRSSSNIHSSYHDPLNSVINTDLGLRPISQEENKEVVKLKLELLNYKMETAKLQRKRIEALLQSDAAERETKALETSFRLRAARLEAVAAEMKLPPAHPSLSYTTEEARAQLYTGSYHNT